MSARKSPLNDRKKENEQQTNVCNLIVAKKIVDARHESTQQLVDDNDLVHVSEKRDDDRRMSAQTTRFPDRRWAHSSLYGRLA